MIQATVVADSINIFGDRIISMLVTMPRIVLSELNTHRMLSKNSASSRAIPFKKMVEAVRTNPFIPIAWQKDHRGMQGKEYLDNLKGSSLDEQFNDNFSAREILNGIWADDSNVGRPGGSALYHMIEIATELNRYGATKQLANRLLEPFMWHTILITATEWDNFFALRCPRYTHNWGVERSRKDYSEKYVTKDYTELDWLKINKGQAEIHMMAVAEAIWDAKNASVPKLLQPGEWHIIFENKLDINALTSVAFKNAKFGVGAQHELDDYVFDTKLKVTTSMGARTSFTVIGEEKEVSYERLVEIHDEMFRANPFHASPFEHNAQAMGEEEYDKFGKITDNIIDPGWCRNFKGFIQYRHFVEQLKQKP